MAGQPDLLDIRIYSYCVIIKHAYCLSNELRNAFIRDRMSWAASVVTGVCAAGVLNAGLSFVGCVLLRGAF